MPVKLLALDIGGVLAIIDKSPIQTLVNKNNVFCGNLFDEDFIMLQKGYIDVHSFLGKKSLILNAAKPLLQNAFATMMIATAQKILPRINIDYFFMSNINEIHFDSFLAQINATDFSLENSCLSYRIGQLKPDPAFFKKAIGHFCIPPSEILFIDDKTENINAAERAGFATVQCFSPHDLENILSRHRLI